MGAMACAAGLLTSCDKNGSGNDAPPAHPMSGTYRFASYEVTEKESGEQTVANFPVSGPLYAVWEAKTDTGESEGFTDNMQGVFRMMGAALLPQILNTVELRADGYVGASYVAEPQVVTDKLMGWATGTIFNSTYPTVEDVTADAAAGPFEKTGAEDKFVSWSEKGGVLTLKIDIDAVLADAGNEDMAELVKEVLAMEPAAIKGMLATVLEDESLNGISDAAIVQLKGWIQNGIPMTVKEESGKTNLYLPKTAFDLMMTMRETGEVDSWGGPVMKNDLMIIWDALNKAGLIPSDAAMAGAMLNMMGAYWDKTTEFSLGLSLVKAE